MRAQCTTLYLRRELIGVAGELEDAAYRSDLDDPAADMIERTEMQLYQLAERGDTGTGFVPIGTAMTEALVAAEAAYKRGARTVGVATGLHDLDKLLGGLHPSDLVILAGRPSMGKTALASTIGMHAAQNGVITGMFSIEMARMQLGARALAGAAPGIPSDWIRRGDLNQVHFEQLIEAQRRLADVPFLIDETPAISVAGLRSRARP